MSDLIDRDEVIEIIESVCSADDSYWQPGPLEKIRNLPTHPTPFNTLGALDCVSREELTKRIEAYFDGLPIQVHYDMLALAQKLPSAQPKTTTISIGRTKGETTMWYECDACGEPIDIKDNFCRNCGRRLMKNE